MTALQIVIGTESALKIRALSAAANAIELSATIVPCNAVSGITAQPVSTASMAIGAHNRLLSAEALHPNADLYVSIESGLVRLGNNDWFDQSYIFARTRSKKESFSYSAPFPVPHWMVQRTLGKHTDLGTLIQGLHTGKEKDPEAYLSKNLILREQLISQAVQCALLPLFHPERFKEH